MALTLERKLQVGLMIPIISSGKRREYVPAGSTAASMPPSSSPETTEISLTCMVQYAGQVSAIGVKGRTIEPSKTDWHRQ
jgi:hypothetical protein